MLDLPTPTTLSARRMMLALERDGLEPVPWAILTIRLRPMPPERLPTVADQLIERGWVEVAGAGPTRQIRLTSAGMNALGAGGEF